MEVFQVCPCKTIAVTGSDGKTTTTTIIAELLKAAGQSVYVGGNIGKPLLPDVDGMVPEDVAVLELSSFQLMTMEQSPDIAVVTNLAPNHLDVHKSMEEYITAKENIFTHQGADGLLVLNQDNEITRGFAVSARGRVTRFSRREELEQGVFVRDGPSGCATPCTSARCSTWKTSSCPASTTSRITWRPSAPWTGWCPTRWRDFAAKFAGRAPH
ncbi:MAG: Mur ligase family protein [Flavonifractor plautii]